MSFATLALVGLVAVLGPVLATPRAWQVPVVVGELVAGIVLGPTVTEALHASQPTFAFLADVGFVLVMFVAGTHVPVRDARLRESLRVGAARAAAVGVLAVLAGLVLAWAFGTGHGLLYAVLMGCSSAALVVPVVNSLGVPGDSSLELLAQVAVADTACIVALPLAIDPRHAGRAAVGAVTVMVAAAVVFLVLRKLEQTGVRRRVHVLSEGRKFALELRVSLVAVFALAALAVREHVSVMLAGFAFGLAVAAVGEPRRLARQLFAVTEGFLGPLFFVWLGTSLDLRDLGEHPKYAGLGVALGAGALVVHAAMRLAGQQLAFASLAAAQLGVPVAAATLGTQLHVLHEGEAPALVLGALVTIAVSLLSRGTREASPPGSGDGASQGSSPRSA